MSERSQAVLLVASALGMILGLMGNDLKSWADWSPLFTPATVGQFFLNVSSVISAFTGGILWKGREGSKFTSLKLQ